MNLDPSESQYADSITYLTFVFLYNSIYPNLKHVTLQDADSIFYNVLQTYTQKQNNIFTLYQFHLTFNLMRQLRAQTQTLWIFKRVIKHNL